MKVKIFVKKDCPKCPPAKKIGEKLKKKNINVEFYDVATIEGLSEAQFFSVMATPTIVISQNGEEIKSWRGEIPSMKELEKELK